MEEQTDNTYGFLDIVVILAESWIILLALPIVAGLLAGWYVVSRPPLYRVEAIVGIIDQAPRIAASVEFETKITEVLNAGQENPVDTPQAAIPHLTIVNDSRASTTSVSTTTETATGGSEILAAAVRVLREVFPPDLAKEEIKVKGIEDGVAWIDQTLVQIKGALDAAAKHGSAEGQLGIDALARALLAVTHERADRLEELAEARSELKIAQQRAFGAPLIVAKAAGPDSRLVFLAVAATGVLGLFIAFCRNALKRARTDAGSAQAIQRIRSAFFLRPQPGK